MPKKKLSYEEARARLDAKEKQDIAWARKLAVGTPLLENQQWGQTLLLYHTEESTRKEGMSPYGTWYQHQIAPVEDRPWIVLKRGHDHTLVVTTSPRPIRLWVENRHFRLYFRKA